MLERYDRGEEGRGAAFYLGLRGLGRERKEGGGFEYILFTFFFGLL